MDKIKKQDKRNKPTVKRILCKPVLIPAAVLVVCLGAFLSLSLFSPKDIIARNVYIQDVNLGGMRLEEATAAIEEADYLDDIVINLEYGGQKRAVSSMDIKLSINAEESAKKALELCKSGNIFKRSYDQLLLFFTKKELGCVPRLDEEALNGILYEFGASVNGEMVDPQVAVEGETATITPGAPGQSRDTSEALNQVVNAIIDGTYDHVPLTLERSNPEDLTVDSAYELIHKEPQDAYYEYAQKSVSIVDHIVGYDADKTALETAVKQVNNGETATVPVTITQPAVTTEILQSKLFNTTLASYSTTFSTAAANRASNVALAASKINDTVLAPGQVFSYAESVGNPSEANGFLVAPVYENGKTSQGVGGGVCQVSSTLYSAVLYADLEVVQRQNHSLTVAYVPKGQDATFAYGAIDFKFKNDTDYPVKISSGASNGTLTVSIIGTKRDVDRTVQLSHKVVSTTNPTVTEKEDPTLPAGTRKVVSTGKSGYVVETTKTVYENGAVVSSKVITKSTYKMVPTEVSVGTKAAAASAPVYEVPTPAPTVAPATPAPTPEPTPPPATPAPTPAPTEQPETPTTPPAEAAE